MKKLPEPMHKKLAGLRQCISFVTLAELIQWTKTRNWGMAKQEALDEWLLDVIVIGSDEKVSRIWGTADAATRQRGRTRPTNDSWIAACCMRYDLPLATHNVKDFADYVKDGRLALITQ